MTQEPHRPTTQVTSAQALARAQLDTVLGEEGALAVLRRLVNGTKGTRISEALQPALYTPSTGTVDLATIGADYERLFGHEGLGGEFGNGIGNTLMRAKDYIHPVGENVHLVRYDNDNGMQLPKYLGDIRHCWREKWSKATEYGDRSEVAGAAMQRLGNDIQHYADQQHAQGLLPDTNYHTVCMQLTEYRAALAAIESLVVAIEALPELPRRSSTPSLQR